MPNIIVKAVMKSQAVKTDNTIKPHKHISTLVLLLYDSSVLRIIMLTVLYPICKPNNTPNTTETKLIL
jgi:hypothetical protein